MRSNVRVAGASLLVLLAALAVTHGQDAAAPNTAKPSIAKLKFLITGLHCPPCSSVVERSLAGVPGVRAAKVDWSSKNATIEIDERKVSAQAVARRIAATPHMMGGGMKYGGWLALTVDGVDDAATAEKAKAALQAVDGVKQVAVYPAQKSVGVAFDEQGNVTTDSLIKSLKSAGLEARNY